MSDLIEKLIVLEKNYKGTSYQHLIDKCFSHYTKKDYEKVRETMTKFPSKKELFEKFVESLKGKSVYASIRKLNNGEDCDNLDKLKVYSSIMTHLAIECKKGNLEFKQFLPDIYEKIARVLYLL